MAMKTSAGPTQIQGRTPGCAPSGRRRTRSSPTTMYPASTAGTPMTTASSVGSCTVSSWPRSIPYALSLPMPLSAPGGRTRLHLVQVGQYRVQLGLVLHEVEGLAPPGVAHVAGHQVAGVEVGGLLRRQGLGDALRGLVGIVAGRHVLVGGDLAAPLDPDRLRPCRR